MPERVKIAPLPPSWLPSAREAPAGASRCYPILESSFRSLTRRRLREIRKKNVQRIASGTKMARVRRKNWMDCRVSIPSPFSAGPEADAAEHEGDEVVEEAEEDAQEGEGQVAGDPSGRSEEQAALDLAVGIA